MTPVAAHTILGNIAGPGGGGGGGVPPDLVFAISWDGDLGDTSAARLSENRARPFRYIGDSNSGMTVVTTPGSPPVLPSAQCLDMDQVSGQIYAHGFETPWWSDLGEGQYITMRYIMWLEEPDAVTPQLFVSPTDTNYNAGQMTRGNTYELQCSVVRLTGNDYDAYVVVYELDPSDSFSRTLVADTDDFGFPSPIDAGAASMFNGARDIVWGCGEDIIATPNDPFHPFYFLWWENGDLFSDDSLLSWHFDTTGASEASSDFCHISCLTVCKGDNANREWPLREWSTDEEAWSPS